MKMKKHNSTNKKIKRHYSTNKETKKNKRTKRNKVGFDYKSNQSHQVAIAILNQGKPIRAKDVNKVLAPAGIKINQDTLNKLLNKPRLVFTNLDSNTTKSDLFMKNLGKIRSSKKVPGVYIWTHKSTGKKYVGSSSELARRLTGYFNYTHPDTGKFIPFLKSEGVGAFTLEVIPLGGDDYSNNHEHCLEQFFLLHPEFNLNTLRVVNSISGVRAKPLYLYTKDYSELIYQSDVQEDFIFGLGIHHSIFSGSLKTGKLYLNKYIFSDKLVLGAKNHNYSLEDVNELLASDRELEKSKGRKITLLPAEGGDGDTKEFFSIKDCVAFLNTIAPSNKTTLYRHIESGKPYRGYICKLDIDVRDATISITDTISNITVSYITFREAALSFSPKTTGQTVKTYAENGHLFRSQYKISLVYN